MFASLSIKTKAALIATVGVLTVFFAFATIEAGQIRRDMQQVIGRQQLTLVKRIAAEFDDKIAVTHRALIATAAGIPPALIDDSQALARALEKQPGYRSLFDDVFVIGRDGRVLIEFPDLKRRGIDVSDRNYFRRTMETAAPFISEPYMGRGLKEPTVMMTAPLLDAKGRVAGMLTGALHPLKPNLLGRIRETSIGETGWFAMFTRERMIVVSRRESRIMTAGPAPGISTAFDHAMTGEAGWEESTNSMGLHGVFSYAPLHEVPWVLFAVLPADEAFAPIRQAQRRIIGSGIALAVLMAVAVWFLLQRLLAPLGVLRDTIRRVQHDPAAATPVQTVRGDEIGDLANDFNRMIESLHERTRKLDIEKLRLEAIFRTASDGIHVLDSDGRLIEANDAFLGMLGYGKDAIGRLFVTDWDAKDDRAVIVQRNAALMETRKTAVFETVHRRRDGALIDVEISACGIEIEGRMYLYASSRDISARKQAQAAIAKLNAELEMRVAARTAELQSANKELDSFCYTIAHDMRAPVRAINGFSEMVLKGSEEKLDSTAVGYLRRIGASGRRMGDLIDDLLGMARLTRQEMRRGEVNLSAAAEQVVASLRAAHPERNVAVTLQPAVCVNGDPGLLRAVLENLIGNAWKYTAKTAAPTIEFGAENRVGRLVIFVRDNGAGFDMQYVRKLFAPFQRLHHESEFEGTGIGLATVRRIIERHGGEIWIDSAINAGTTVYFTFGAVVA